MIRTPRRLPLALVAAVSLAGCAGRTVWLGPNIGSRDELRFFTQPNEWRYTRERTAVFQFYARQLGADADCPECGDNVLDKFVAAGAFRRLRDWDVSAAVEVAAVKEWGCSAGDTLPAALRVLRKVRDAGGVLAFASMDEPLAGGQRCGQTADATATEAARFAQSLRADSPGLRVGDIEPYPQFSVEELTAWLDALASQGAAPAFFHLDVDRERAARMMLDVPGDLRAIKAACRSRGIPFGVIFWGGDGLTEDAYAADVLAWVAVVRGAGIDPEHLVFQSWSASADGRREVPRNLPENDPAVWTHTRLLLAGLAGLEAGR